MKMVALIFLFTILSETPLIQGVNAIPLNNKIGDISGKNNVPDGKIDFNDLSEFAALYITGKYYDLIDFNRDSNINSEDIIILVDSYNLNSVPSESTYIISIEGATITALSSSGSRVASGTDFGAVFNTVNTRLENGESVSINLGTYRVDTQPILTKRGIQVTGCAGTILQHGHLGDYPIFTLKGIGNTVKKLQFDDAFYPTGVDYSKNINIGSNGVVVVQGIDNTLDNCTLIRTTRYGFLLGQSTRGTISNCETFECQYGISGTSGSGNAYWAVDGHIFGNKLHGFRLLGIKIKSFDGVIIENNEIDCRATLPSQINNPVGIEYSADAPSFDTIVRNNHIYMSGTDSKAYQFGVLTDHLPFAAFPGTVESGNQIINNQIANVKYGVYLKRTAGFYINGNTFTNVNTPLTTLASFSRST